MEDEAGQVKEIRALDKEKHEASLVTEMTCVREAGEVVDGVDREIRERDTRQADFDHLTKEKDRLEKEWRERGQRLYEAEVKVRSLQSKLSKCSEKLSEKTSSRSLLKKLKRREGSLERNKQESENSFVQNRELQEAKAQLEAKIQDLSERLDTVSVERKREAKTRSYLKKKTAKCSQRAVTLKEQVSVLNNQVEFCKGEHATAREE